MVARDESGRASRHEDEVGSLTAQISFLDEEIAVLRRRLADSPRQVRLLEERLRETEASLTSVTTQNERLASTLREARDQIVALKEEVDRLAQPPSGFGIFLAVCEDNTADVFTGGRKMRVNVSPNIDLDELRPGQEVVLNEALNVVIAQGYETVGEIVMLKELLADGERALVISHADEERVVRLAAPLLDQVLRSGDSLLLEPQVRLRLRAHSEGRGRGAHPRRGPRHRLHRHRRSDLADRADQGRDRAALPARRPVQGAPAPPAQGRPALRPARLRQDAHRQGGRQLPRQAGPDQGGGGRRGRVTGAKKPAEGKSFFLNIKGPELLNKYVGETERHIRLVFQRAREKASEGMPVIVFFDEMDSIFRTRGSGVSSDVENTIVPQLLSEIDGVEGLENVIVIGASNREDMIDPAILRPGRLDVKIKIERPDAEAAKDIFSKYVLTDLPLHPDDVKEHGGSEQETVDAMIQRTVERMYTETEENRFLEVTYANGDKEVLYFKDFNSGAMIENIVARAKQMAIKQFLDTGQKGIRVAHLLAACVDEFSENEDLPNTTNPDDWARISGKKGERIVYIRTLVSGKQGTEAGRSIDTVANTGQYL